MLTRCFIELPHVLAQIPVVQKGLARDEIDEDIVHANVSMQNPGFLKRVAMTCMPKSRYELGCSEAYAKTYPAERVRQP